MEKKKQTLSTLSNSHFLKKKKNVLQIIPRLENDNTIATKRNQMGLRFSVYQESIQRISKNDQLDLKRYKKIHQYEIFN